MAEIVKVTGFKRDGSSRIMVDDWGKTRKSRVLLSKKPGIDWAVVFEECLKDGLSYSFKREVTHGVDDDYISFEYSPGEDVQKHVDEIKKIVETTNDKLKIKLETEEENRRKKAEIAAMKKKELEDFSRKLEEIKF